MSARHFGSALLLACTLGACPAVFVAELQAPAAIAPGESFTVVARVQLSRALAAESPQAHPTLQGPLAGRAHLAVRAPTRFDVRGAYLVGDDEHALTPAPIVAAAYQEAHPMTHARWFAFVTRLHTGLRGDAMVRVRLTLTAPTTLPDVSSFAFGAGLAPSYPGWQRVPEKLRVLALPTKPR